MLMAGRVAGVVLVAILAGCSGSGGGDNAASTTTTTAPTTTSEATTTTLSPEEQVKAAYLAYWQMADRLNGKPDPNDPELAQRAVEPLLSTIRDGLTTQAAQGRTFVVRPGRPNDHRLSQVQVDVVTATVADCFVDGRSAVDSTGAMLDDAVVSKLGTAKLINESGAWKVSELRFDERSPGVSGCAN